MGKKLMKKELNNVLAIAVLTFASSLAYSNVNTCNIDGKVVYQQLPCPVAIVEPGCDESFDYSDNVDDVDASFGDKYCYYLQLENVDKQEKERLMAAYKEKRAEALEVAKQAYFDQTLMGQPQENTSFVE